MYILLLVNEYYELVYHPVIVQAEALKRNQHDKWDVESRTVDASQPVWTARSRRFCRTHGGYHSADHAAVKQIYTPSSTSERWDRSLLLTRPIYILFCAFGLDAFVQSDLK